MVQLPFSPAAERNRHAIHAALSQRLQPVQQVLEIGSGSGQHAIHMAAEMPHLRWQPSERASALSGLRLVCEQAGLDNLLTPIVLDVAQAEWPKVTAEATFAANVAHIISWQNVQTMFSGVARLLPAGAHFYLYGPFHRNGEPTSAGNASFDLQLRSPENPDGNHQGIRDDKAMAELAMAAQLHWDDDIAMPANNRILVYTRLRSG